MTILIDAEQLSKNKYVGIGYDRAVSDGIEHMSEHIYAYKCGWNDAIDAIIDYAPKVVRCRDCKYWRDGDCKIDSHGYCPISENDFCSQGERREDAGE